MSVVRDDRALDEWRRMPMNDAETVAVAVSVPFSDAASGAKAHEPG
jgi:hypothetical protein